jgi:TetR/AcrR family transcriptional repressor of nem operon
MIRLEMMIMPYPKGHKERVRGLILASAAKAFRTNGVRDISVPAVMKGAGLTHGGFYSYFKSKDQLILESCKAAVDETIEVLTKVAEEAAGESRVDAVIDYYLSPLHRDNAETGCIFPAISGEIMHLSREVRDEVTVQLERIIDFLSQLANISKSAANALFSLMLGTIVLARSVSDPDLSDSLLDSGRRHARNLLLSSRNSNLA